METCKTRTIVRAVLKKQEASPDLFSNRTGSSHLADDVYKKLRIDKSSVKVASREVDAVESAEVVEAVSAASSQLFCHAKRAGNAVAEIGDGTMPEAGQFRGEHPRVVGCVVNLKVVERPHETLLGVGLLN